MKRVIKMILFCSLIILGLNQIIIKGNDFSLTTLEYESKQFDGVSHFGRTVNMELKDKSKQKFNVLEFDNKDDNIHLVTISNYINFKWGMTPLEGMIIDYLEQISCVAIGINTNFPKIMRSHVKWCVEHVPNSHCDSCAHNSCDKIFPGQPFLPVKKGNICKFSNQKDSNRQLNVLDRKSVV